MRRAVMVVALAAIATAACAASVPGITFRTIRVLGVSMSPTLNNGDILSVAPIGKLSDVRRGDVLAFADPIDSTKFFIKRVIGLPGDRLEIVDSVVYVRPLGDTRWYTLREPYLNRAEPWTIATTWPDPPSVETIGPAELFVLGDNRNRSTDSRVFGPVPFDMVAHFDRGEGRITGVIGGRSDLGRPELEPAAGPPQ